MTRAKKPSPENKTLEIALAEVRSEFQDHDRYVNRRMSDLEDSIFKLEQFKLEQSVLKPWSWTDYLIPAVIVIYIVIIIIYLIKINRK